MNGEDDIAGHYAKGGLEQKVLGSLARAGLDLSRLTVADLGPVDEYHVGSLESTRELAAQMELRAGMKLLDVGCGIGGPARYFASVHGCHVTGIDLTEEFVGLARQLTKMLKLQEQVQFEQGSALRLPFKDASFDGAYLIHVGMNLADKPAVWRELRRVLKPGALFTIFDILRSGTGAISFPVPWSLSEEGSFVEDAVAYRKALAEAGFQVERERSRREFAIAFTEAVASRTAAEGLPPLGLHILMGEQTPLMLRNVLEMMKRGVLEPREIFARAT
jgi:ubiquinone/menaquinone biosynthesis C-methylase UbiE